MEDQDYTEPPPPSPEKVARRAIVLSVVSCRGFVDGDKADPKAASNLAKRSFDWLLSLGLDTELNDWERKVLSTPFGDLESRDRLNASWLSESVSVLAWALNRADMPSFDTQCDPAGVANSLGFLQSVNATVLLKPSLRHIDETDEYNEFIYNIHWRLRDFSLNKKRYDFESLARKAWGDPLLRHGLKIKDHDLCITGKPISEVPDKDWRPMLSITQERHRASNWIKGYASEDFYEVTTDT